MSTNEANETILAIGALAEICGEFYRQLIKQNFSQSGALFLTSEYLKTTITPRNTAHETDL